MTLAGRGDRAFHNGWPRRPGPGFRDAPEFDLRLIGSPWLRIATGKLPIHPFHRGERLTRICETCWRAGHTTGAHHAS